MVFFFLYVWNCFFFFIISRVCAWVQSQNNCDCYCTTVRIHRKTVTLDNKKKKFVHGTASVTTTMNRKRYYRHGYYFPSLIFVVVAMQPSMVFGGIFSIPRRVLSYATSTDHQPSAVTLRLCRPNTHVDAQSTGNGARRQSALRSLGLSERYRHIITTTLWLVCLTKFLRFYCTGKSETMRSKRQSVIDFNLICIGFLLPGCEKPENNCIFLIININSNPCNNK